MAYICFGFLIYKMGSLIPTLTLKSIEPESGAGQTLSMSPFFFLSFPDYFYSQRKGRLRIE